MGLRSNRGADPDITPSSLGSVRKAVIRPELSDDSTILD